MKRLLATAVFSLLVLNESLHRAKPALLRFAGRYCGLGSLALLLVLATGCATPRPVALHTRYAECPRPAPIALPALDAGAHIGSAVNVAALLEAIDTLALTIVGLSTALTCYERQAELAATGRP